MGKVKESIMTIEDMFNEEFKKFELMLKYSLESFCEKNYDKEDNMFEIEMATCEGKLLAYVNVAKELLGDESLMEKYEAAIEKYADDVLNILNEMDAKEEEEEKR